MVNYVRDRKIWSELNGELLVDKFNLYELI